MSDNFKEVEDLDEVHRGEHRRDSDEETPESIRAENLRLVPEETKSAEEIKRDRWEAMREDQRRYGKYCIGGRMTR